MIKNIMGKKKIMFILIMALTFIFSIFFENKRIEKLEQEKQAALKLEKQQIEEITSHYNSYVKTNIETDLFIFENDEYTSIGKIGANVELTLNTLEITGDTEYFEIVGMSNIYFIKYSDVEPIESLSEKNKRYQNYIPFNENVVTKKTTRFYKDDGLVYEINESYSLPILIKDGNKIYVEYENQLLYVLYEEIDSIVENVNSDKEKATKIGTIVYHFIYNPDNGEECNQIICHTVNQVQSHIDYLKSENYFTPTMAEFEMYIDGKLQLPKNSVVITVDDGWFGGNARDIFTKNEMNATIFVITSGYDPSGFVTEYVEVHSHSHNLHNPGVCPGGQGGAIKCADKSFLLEDLKLSRERTFNSTVFCYPFYEYNSYSIEVLKEAGFTMAFGGEYAGGYDKMVVGGDKYRIPRYTLLGDSSVAELKNFLNR